MGKNKSISALFRVIELKSYLRVILEEINSPSIKSKTFEISYNPKRKKGGDMQREKVSVKAKFNGSN